MHHAVEQLGKIASDVQGNSTAHMLIRNWLMGTSSHTWQSLTLKPGICSGMEHMLKPWPHFAATVLLHVTNTNTSSSVISRVLIRADVWYYLSEHH